MNRNWADEQQRLEGEREIARSEVERLAQLIRARVGVMQTPDASIVTKYRSARARLEGVNTALADLLQQRVLQEQT